MLSTLIGRLRRLLSPAQRPSINRTRPHLESLEDRWVPSAPTFHGGSVLQNPDVVPVYFGSVNPTFQAAVQEAAGNYTRILGVFGVQSATVDNPVVLPNPGSFTNQSLSALLSTDVANGSLPAPTPGRLYMFMVPQASMPDVPNAGAYHTWASAGGTEVPFTVSFVVGPNAGTYGVFHEYAEATTDPFPGWAGHEGWYGSSYYQEIADLSGGTFSLDGFQVATVIGPNGQPITSPTPFAPIGSPPPPINNPGPVTPIINIPNVVDIYGGIFQEIAAFEQQLISFIDNYFASIIQWETSLLNSLYGSQWQI